MAITRVSTQGLTRSGTAIADVPDAPTIGAISDPGTDGYATVAFTAAATGGAVTTYTATSTPGSITATSATSPITVTGLTLNTAYTFKVKGANSTATGAESAASSSFTTISHWSPSDAYEPIAVATVPAAGISSVTFGSIPQTYTHLQIRYSGNAGSNDTFFRLNGDTSSNYTRHYLFGSGSSAAAGASLSQTSGSLGYVATTSDTNIFGASVFDLLDYTNTNKYKTTRSLTGYDNNGGGLLVLYSGLWLSTAAVTSITVLPNTGNFNQYTNIALYGIKGN
jgi:hypothetical protein